MKTAVIKGFHAFTNWCYQHSNVLLTGAEIVGLYLTVGMTAKATVDAHNEVLSMGMSKDAISKKDIVKATWKYYIPTTAGLVATTACAIGNSSLSAKKAAALAGLYSTTESAFKAYKEKVIEQIGKKKEENIRHDIVKDKIEANPASNSTVIVTGKGDVLCYDELSGRYFKSDIEKMRRIENDINKRLLSEMYISLNEVYYELSLPPIGIGDDLGWDVYDKLEFSFSSQIADNGEPCIVLQFVVSPRANYK